MGAGCAGRAAARPQRVGGAIRLLARTVATRPTTLAASPAAKVIHSPAPIRASRPYCSMLGPAIRSTPTTLRPLISSRTQPTHRAAIAQPSTVRQASTPHRTPTASDSTRQNVPTPISLPLMTESGT